MIMVISRPTNFPCVNCRTVGGAIHKNEAKPSRSRGLCSRCYSRLRERQKRADGPARVALVAAREAKEIAKAPTPDEIAKAAEIERNRRWSGLKPKVAITVAESCDLYWSAWKRVKGLKGLSVEQMRLAQEAVK